MYATFKGSNERSEPVMRHRNAGLAEGFLSGSLLEIIRATVYDEVCLIPLSVQIAGLFSIFTYC
jgi:hypothetical protein